MPAWTSELPTQPGWYWFTHKHKGNWQKPQMVELDIFEGEMCEVQCTQDGGDYVPIEYWWGTTRWMVQGPLSVPELPK